MSTIQRNRKPPSTANARMTASDKKWNKIWNEKGAHGIAMETARRKLKIPLYTSYFGETGNFHKAGNTNAIRKQRVAKQQQLVNDYLHMLKGPQPKHVNQNRRREVGDAYVHMMQGTRMTEFNKRWNALWNTKGARQIARETAARTIQNPRYRVVRGENGNFRGRNNNNAGVKRTQRMATQKNLVARELKKMTEQCRTMLAMQRTGSRVSVPAHCRARNAR